MSESSSILYATIPPIFPLVDPSSSASSPISNPTFPPNTPLSYDTSSDFSTPPIKNLFPSLIQPIQYFPDIVPPTSISRLQSVSNVLSPLQNSSQRHMTFDLNTTILPVDTLYQPTTETPADYSNHPILSHNNDISSSLLDDWFPFNSFLGGGDNVNLDIKNNFELWMIPQSNNGVSESATSDVANPNIIDGVPTNGVPANGVPVNDIPANSVSDKPIEESTASVLSKLVLILLI